MPLEHRVLSTKDQVRWDLRSGILVGSNLVFMLVFGMVPGKTEVVFHCKDGLSR